MEEETFAPWKKETVRESIVIEGKIYNIHPKHVKKVKSHRSLPVCLKTLSYSSLLKRENTRGKVGREMSMVSQRNGRSLVYRRRGRGAANRAMLYSIFPKSLPKRTTSVFLFARLSSS